jgi:hypothetical protein
MIWLTAIGILLLAALFGCMYLIAEIVRETNEYNRY